MKSKAPGLRVPQIYQVTRAASPLTMPANVDACAIKATHGSAMTVVVRSREEFAARKSEIEAKAAKWLSFNYSENNNTLEWCYRDIPPQIVFEELLDDGTGSVGDEYRFYTFSGKIEMIQVFRDKLGSNRRCFLKPDWSSFGEQIAPLRNHFEAPRPPQHVQLEQTALALAGNMDFIRVDLYLINGEPVFGELTNYPSGGASPWRRTELDRLLGVAWRDGLKRASGKVQ